MKEENKKKWNIFNFLEVVLIIIVFIAFIGNLNYIDVLEQEIQNRDVKIEILLKNDSLLHQIMEFRTDTLKHTESYTVRLKNGKVLSYNKMSAMLDSTQNKYTDVLNKLQKVKYELQLKNDVYQSALALIKKNYGIDYKLRMGKDSFSVSLITPNKLDSALILFPHFKSRLEYFKEKDNRIIYSIRH